jgi:hypothetical protein
MNNDDDDDDDFGLCALCIAHGILYHGYYGDALALIS